MKSHMWLCDLTDQKEPESRNDSFDKIMRPKMRIIALGVYNGFMHMKY